MNNRYNNTDCGCYKPGSLFVEINIESKNGTHQNEMEFILRFYVYGNPEIISIHKNHLFYSNGKYYAVLNENHFANGWLFCNVDILPKEDKIKECESICINTGILIGGCNHGCNQNVGQLDSGRYIITINRVDTIPGIPNNQPLSNRVSISENRTWIVDGVDTGFASSPLLKNVNNKLYYSYDNLNWEPCSDEIAHWFRINENKLQISSDKQNWKTISDSIAAYFRFVVTESESQGGTIGKIQISRDNKEWSDLSPVFTNNLRIKDYVSLISELPLNAPAGTVYGVGPTYSEDDTIHINPIYTLYVWNGTKWINNGRFTSIAAGVVQGTGNSETEVMSQKATTEKLTELDSKKADSTKELSFEEGVDIEDEEGNKIVEVTNNAVKVFGKKVIGKEDIPLRAITIVENLPDSNDISIEDDNGNEVLGITPDAVRLFGNNTFTRHVAESIESKECLEEEIVIEDNYGNEVFAATPTSVRVMGKTLSGYSGSSSEGQRLPQLTIGTLKYGNYTSSGVVSSTTSLVSDTIGVPYRGAKLYISINDNYIVDVYSSFINGDYGTEYNSKIGAYYNQEVVLLPDYANNREITYLRFVVRKIDNSSISNLKEHSLEVSYEDNYNVVDSNAQQLDHAQAMAYKFVTKNAKFNDKAVFVHGSDIHSDWLRAENLFKVADAINADGVIMTGDLMAHNYTDGISPLTDIIKKYKTNHYFCIGNHEVGYNYLGKQFALSDQEVYNKLIADNIGNNWVINGKTYYYSDITEKGIRIISVNQYIEGAENGTSLLRWALHYNQEEIDWIISTLASTPAGYGVLMINHTPEIISSAIDGNNEFYSDGYNSNNNPTSSVTGYILRDIVDAFIAKSSINKTYPQQGIPASLAVSANFSTSQADFIGYCNGHYHGDAITKVTGAEQYQLQLNIMGTVSYYGGSAYPFQNETSDLARNSKNKNGDAFNVYIIDKTNKEVEALRIGANYKWDGSERKFINIKYK